MENTAHRYVRSCSHRRLHTALSAGRTRGTSSFILNCPLSILHYVRVRHRREQRRQWMGPGRPRQVTTGYGHDAPPLFCGRRGQVGVVRVGCGMLKRRRAAHGCFRSGRSPRISSGEVPASGPDADARLGVASRTSAACAAATPLPRCGPASATPSVPGLRPTAGDRPNPTDHAGPEARRAHPATAGVTDDSSAQTTPASAE